MEKITVELTPNELVWLRQIMEAEHKDPDSLMSTESEVIGYGIVLAYKAVFGKVPWK